MLRVDGILIEEKCGPDETLIEEVGCERCEPIKQVEASTRLEHEKCDRLLHEQADYDGLPLDVGLVPGRRPKAKLKHDQAEYGDCAVTVVGALGPRSADQWVDNNIKIDNAFPFR